MERKLSWLRRAWSGLVISLRRCTTVALIFNSINSQTKPIRRCTTRPLDQRSGTTPTRGHSFCELHGYHRHHHGHLPLPEGASPTIEIIGVQPQDGSRIPGFAGGHQYLPKIYDERRVGQIIDVSAEIAAEHTRALATEEGLFVGLSSGGACAAALRWHRTPNQAVSLCLSSAIAVTSIYRCPLSSPHNETEGLNMQSSMKTELEAAASTARRASRRTNRRTEHRFNESRRILSKLSLEMVPRSRRRTRRRDGLRRGQKHHLRHALC